VDDVVIIARGRLVHSSSLADLAALVRRQVRVASPDAAGLAALVGRAGWTAATPPGAPPGVLDVLDVDAAAIGAAAHAAGLELHQLATQDVGLEQVFLQLTADNGRAA